MSGAFNIRAAHAADRDWIVVQHGVLYRAEFGFDETYQQGIAGKMRALVERNEAFTRILIAEIDRERAGSIAISALPEGGAFLNFVLVSPEHRRQGIAELLLQRVIDHARENACRFVQLETYSVLEGARRLYARSGFAIAKVEPGMTRFGQKFDQEFWEMRF